MKKPLFSLILALFILAGCSKENIEIRQPIKENCLSVWLVSDKYTVDTNFLRRDTVWYDLSLCGRWIDSCKKQGDYWILFCDPPIPSMPNFILEHRIYIFKPIKYN